METRTWDQGPANTSTRDSDARRRFTARTAYQGQAATAMASTFGVCAGCSSRRSYVAKVAVFTSFASAKAVFEVVDRCPTPSAEAGLQSDPSANPGRRGRAGGRSPRPGMCKLLDGKCATRPTLTRVERRSRRPTWTAPHGHYRARWAACRCRHTSKPLRQLPVRSDLDAGEMRSTG